MFSKSSMFTLDLLVLLMVLPIVMCEFLFCDMARMLSECIISNVIQCITNQQ
uniref:Uncharacterized protein n=1 Tax=Anguilla anguilla TaxID=7936 RepID=A0A0E9RXX6_ANGAN